MIEIGKIKDLIKSYLPQSEELIIENIAQDILQDVEAVLHSKVRQAVAQERENLYRKKSKDS